MNKVSARGWATTSPSGIEVAAIFKVLYHFAANGDEKFLDLLVGDGVEITKTDGVATAREHAVTEQNMKARDLD